MARSKIGALTVDPIKDSGSVLLSLVKGEQLEQAVTLSFSSNVLAGYVYEAVVVEAANQVGQSSPPADMQPGGVQTTLTVRVPTYRGVWDAAQAYNMEEIVYYNSKYYRLTAGVARVSNTPPSSDNTWSETTANRLYIQFPSTLGSAWTVQPGTTYHSYGFFELRVTESGSAPFKRTWKPVRGMVEIQFSPTELVPG